MADRDPNRGDWYLPLGWTCTILAIIAVVVRFYTRLFLTRSFGSDDFAIILPLISTAGGQIVDTMSILRGYGRHARFLSAEDIEIVAKHTFILWVRVFISYFFLRASIMLFTLRLLPFTKTKSRRIIYAAFALNFAITLIACVCYGIRCTPFRAAYANVSNPHCKPETLLVASQTTNGALACISDVTTALIPAFLLWDLQMKKQTKWILNCIFLLGLLTAALSVSRAATTNSSTYESDITWSSVLPGVMSAVEEKMGIFFASCPMLRQFLSYGMRTHSILPTNNRNPPNGDFRAMRKRIKLRGIFWYRKATPNDISPPPDAKPNNPKQISARDKEVKTSALDWIEERLGRMFGRNQQHGLRVASSADFSRAKRDSSRTNLASGEVSNGSRGSKGLQRSGHSGETFLLSATNASKVSAPSNATASFSSV